MSAKFLRGDQNIIRHNLRKELAHILRQVTDVTASDIGKFSTNLQIYESYHISN